MNVQVFRVTAGGGIILLIAIAIVLQILIFLSNEPQKIDQSMRLWFGNVGIILIGAMFILVLSALYFLPRLLPEARVLSQDLKAMIREIRDVSSGVKGLTEQVKSSTKISELLQSGVNLAGKAAQALAQR
jgi:hypothetical protein